METIFEAIVYVAVWLVYGTDDQPRSPILRNVLRTIALGGTAIWVAVALGVVAVPPVMVLFTPLVGIGLLIMFVAELEFRHWGWALAVAFAGTALIAAVATGGG